MRLAIGRSEVDVDYENTLFSAKVPLNVIVEGRLHFHCGTKGILLAGSAPGLRNLTRALYFSILSGGLLRVDC